MQITNQIARSSAMKGGNYFWKDEKSLWFGLRYLWNTFNKFFPQWPPLLMCHSQWSLVHISVSQFSLKVIFFFLLNEFGSQFWEQFNSPLTVANLQENSCGKQTNKQAHNLMQHQFGTPNKAIRHSETIQNSKHRWFGRRGNQANARDTSFSERVSIISFIYQSSCGVQKHIVKKTHT